jgi:ribosomal protein L11 methyltransferase
VGEAVEGGWIVVQVRVPSVEDAALLAEGIVTFGTGGVEEHGDMLRAYLPAAGGAAAVDRLREHLEGAIGRAPEIEWELQPDQDWMALWRRGLRPRRLGERLIVTPSWCTPVARPGDEVIIIDPEMAFGTGEHGTTRGALRLLERAMPPGGPAPRLVLDVGTGSGVLAIAAARLGAERVIGAESDADALINAKDNVIRNGTGDRVELVHAWVDNAFMAELDGRVDIILANVLSGVLEPLLPAFRRALRGDGAVILGGILEEEAESMLECAAAAGFEPVEQDMEDEWWTVWLRPRGERGATHG